MVTSALEHCMDEVNLHLRSSHTESFPSSDGYLSMTVDHEPIQSLTQSILIQGCASNALDLIPRESIQTVVTSPPYWSLRDYDVNQQIGCYESLEDYVTDIVETFEKLQTSSRK